MKAKFLVEQLLDESSLWDALQHQAGRPFNDLTEDEMDKHIHLELANAIALDTAGEFAFIMCTPEQMETIINENPHLVRV